MIRYYLGEDAILRTCRPGCAGATSAGGRARPPAGCARAPPRPASRCARREGAPRAGACRPRGTARRRTRRSRTPRTSRHSAHRRLRLRLPVWRPREGSAACRQRGPPSACTAEAARQPTTNAPTRPPGRAKGSHRRSFAPAKPQSRAKGLHRRSFAPAKLPTRWSDRKVVPEACTANAPPPRARPPRESGRRAGCRRTSSSPRGRRTRRPGPRSRARRTRRSRARSTPSGRRR